MNFIEAVQALKDERCEGIFNPNGEYEYKIAENGTHLLSSSGRMLAPSLIKLLLADGWQLVNPKPQMETVEVKRFVVIDKNGCQASYRDKSIAEENAPNSTVVELTGAYDRPVKLKVKRREVVPELFGYGVHGSMKSLKSPFDYKGIKVQFFAEWEEE